MWIFLSYMNLYPKNAWKFYQQFTKTKLNFRRKWASSGFNYQKRLVLLTVHKLFEHYFLKNWLKFYKKVDLSTRMRVIYNIKHRYAIRFEFGDKSLSSLTKLVLEAKATNCSTIKENLFLHCRKFLAFVAVVII